MKKLEHELGCIEYTLPNIPQTLKLLASLGIKGSTNQSSLNELELMATFMEKVEPHINKIELAIAGKKITTWSAFLEESASMEICSTLLSEFMKAIGGGSEDEKKS